MNNKEMKIELDELFDHFNLIFDQQMELYMEWKVKNVPKEIIIWWISYFVIDLVHEDYDKDVCRKLFDRMIEDHSKYH